MFDTCGTGGDRSGTFNISSCAAIVVAACGVRVAKHGNRSVSSRSGSADVFEALGVNVTAPPAVVERCLDEAGIGFFFAPTFHPSMRHAAPARRELGVRTAFNLLGPLTNPAGATRQLVGVPRPEFTELLARALLLLGSERAWVVHGADGIDEISTTGYTKVSECRDGAVNTFYLHPADVGLAEGAAGRAEGRRCARERGDHRGRSRRRARAGAGRRAAECRRGAVHRRRRRVDRDGIARAAQAIDRGDAKRTLERMVALSKAEEIAAASVMSAPAPATADLLGDHRGGHAAHRRGAASSASRCPHWPRGRNGDERAGRTVPRALLRGRSRRVPGDRSPSHHRRVQAPVAVSRRAAAGLRPGGDRAAATSRRAPRRSRC